jgi:hypothetical protein
MSKIDVSRKLVVLFLLMLLLAPWQLTAAERPSPKVVKNGLATQLVQAWAFFLQAWNGKSGVLVGPWGMAAPTTTPYSSEIGSQIDPTGNHGVPAAPDDPDLGSDIDPLG